MAEVWTHIGYTEGSRHSKLDPLDFATTCEIEEETTTETITSVECVSFPSDEEVFIEQLTDTSVRVYVKDPSYLFDRLLITWNYYEDSTKVFTTKDIREVPTEANMFSYKTDPRETIIKTFIYEATSSLGATYTKTLDVIIENNWTADRNAVQSFW